MACVQTQTEVAGKTIALLIGNQNCGAVTFQETGDTVTLAGHTLEAGETVSFSVITTTTGIVIDTDYFVINPSGDTFQLSLTEGGAAIDLVGDGSGTLDESFSPFAGIRSKSFTLNGEIIDITSEDTDQWRKIADEAGISSMSVSGSGIVNDALAYRRARSRMLARKISNFRIVTNNDGDYYQAYFKITSFGGSGEYNAEATYDISLESSGAVTFTAIA